MTTHDRDYLTTTRPESASRYLWRKERQGAFVFDTTQRRVFRIDQATVELTESFVRRDGHAAEAPAAVREFIDGHGRPQYHVLDPLSSLAVPPAPHALAAPNRVYLELTRRCPAHCEACYNAAGKSLPDELSLDDWRNLVRQLAAAGVFEFRFTGGEPTCHAGFLTLLDEALATGRYVSIGTCGLMPRTVLEGIAARAVDETILSYHGPADVHDAFTGVIGCHAKTLEVLRALCGAGRRVRLNVTLNKTTYRTVEDAFALADSLSIATINLIHARPMGRGRNQGTCLSAEENYEHNQRLAAIRGRYRVRVMTDFDLLRPTGQLPARHAITERITSCPAGREFAFVSPEGYVFPCGVAPVAHVSEMTEMERRLFLAGSVRERSFLEIWHASPTWIPYRDLQLCKPDDCRQCGYWGTKCYGTCPPAAYVATGSLAGRDPLCFNHLLEARTPKG